MENVDTSLNAMLEQNDIKAIVHYLLKVDLLIPLKNNLLYTFADKDNKCYIPVYTDEEQITDNDYDELDVKSIRFIIEEIYGKGGSYAIVINPYTHNFILPKESIEIIKKTFVNSK